MSEGIKKSHPKSWMERMHVDSPRASNIMCQGGTYNLIVLQCVPITDTGIIVELVTRDDYEFERIRMWKMDKAREQEDNQ